jgi:ribonuclease P protein subunit POP4
MKVTPDVICSEFIEAEAKVAKSNHPDYAGISGKIVDETKNTFTVLHEGKRKIVAKNTVVFHFKFIDGTIIEIDGKLVVGRPEDRLKRRVRRLW